MSKRSFKLAFFDMDGTVLKGRTVQYFAEHCSLPQITEVLTSDITPYEKSYRIASLLKGQDSRHLLSIFQTIPFQDGMDAIAKRLRDRGIITVLLTDSYQFLADDVRRRLRFDYAFANHLVVKNHIVTGKLIISNARLQSSADGRVYSICKSAFMDALCLFFDADPAQTIAIGDGPIDADMIKKAGLGIAFNAPQDVATVAAVQTDSLGTLLQYL
jgi:phosphoserine phosphatase